MSIYACIKCRVELRCDKNGVGFDWGRGHVYPGDRFKCPKCGWELLAMNSNATFDPEHKTQDEYIQAKKGEFSDEDNQYYHPMVDENIKDAVNSWIDLGLQPGSCTYYLLKGDYEEAFLHAHPLIKPYWEDHIRYIETIPEECRGDNMKTWRGKKEKLRNG